MRFSFPDVRKKNLHTDRMRFSHREGDFGIDN